MQRGYVKLWRSVLESGLKKCPAAGHLFWYLLASASYTPQKVFIAKQLVELPAGAVITGRIALSRELNISEQQVRTALQQLEKMGIVTIKSTSKFSIISLAKWASYNERQSAEPTENPQQATSKQPADNQPAATLKEIKKEEEKKEELTSSASYDAGGAQSFFHEEVLKGKHKILTGKKAEAFNRFWQAFAYKKDKARAIDAWAAIPNITDSLADTICLAAQREAERRPEILSAGRTPIYAQGWISGRRWEDEEQTEAEMLGFKLL